MDWAKPLHRLGVRLARRMLGETPASPPALYVCFSDFLINSNCGLWSLWAKEGAVENGLIVFHGKPSGSP
jgi:hypothetical protein